MKKVRLKIDGLEGSALEFAKRFNASMDSLNLLGAEDVSHQIRSAMAGFVDEEGKTVVDIAKLKELLGEDEKGIRSILKKQGEALRKLQTQTAEPENFRARLNSVMGDLEKVYQTREGEVKLNLRAPAVMSVDAAISGHASLPEELIESFSVAGFVEKRRPREYVFDVASRTTVASLEQYKTWLEEGAEEGTFAIVAEGGLKPLVSTGLVRNSSSYSKAAAKYVVTEEFEKFRKDAYGIIKRLINQKILRDYAAIATTKLIAEAVSYVASALDNQYAANMVTDYHAIAAVSAQIEALDFMPDILVLNPQDKWRIGMSQDTQGQFYLTIPMTDPNGETRMMGLTVRTSNRMAVGSFMLGESGLWNLEDEALSVRMGYGIEVTKDAAGTNVIDVQHDLDHNRMRIIVETFFHSWIGTANSGSFVLADFATVKASVTSV